MSEATTILKTPHWSVLEIKTAAQALKWGKHNGWCTTSASLFDSYIQSGRLFVFKKKGKRRASYQLFAREDHSHFEIKGSGNRPIDLEEFTEKPPGSELTEWLRRLQIDVRKKASGVVFAEGLRFEYEQQPPIPAYSSNRWITEASAPRHGKTTLQRVYGYGGWQGRIVYWLEATRSGLRVIDQFAERLARQVSTDDGHTPEYRRMVDAMRIHILMALRGREESDIIVSIDHAVEQNNHTITTTLSRHSPMNPVGESIHAGVTINPEVMADDCI